MRLVEGRTRMYVSGGETIYNHVHILCYFIYIYAPMSIVFMIVCIHINISHVGSVFTVKTKDFCAQSNPLIYGGRMDIEAVDSK
jgi:hypothetical protein